MASKMGLSKSKYCRGLQCPKMLWMDMNKPEEAEDLNNEFIFETGTKVGDLARSYFGEYSLVDFDFNKSSMVDQTLKYISDGANNIAEASFLADGLYCAVDILHRNDDGWDIIEVKSSAHVSEIYIEDMAFQYYVLTRSGVDVSHIYNLHINNLYVFHDQLDIQGLFVLEDYTSICKNKFAEVESNINRIREYNDTDTEPVKDIDECCNRPYECAYKGYCWKHIPENSVFNIANLGSNKKFDYYKNGIISYEDIISKQPPLNPKQYRQVESQYYSRPDSIDIPMIRSFLAELSYPIYHLDFETFQLAIPIWEGCVPYEQIPFQYSIHIENQDGKIEHREFLAKEGIDPRLTLAENLCRDIPVGGCVLAYNMSFEKTVIRKLAEQFPDLSDHLICIHDNIHDLMVPFQRQYYYSAAMKGSYSIKYVLPALFPNDPELDYHSLEGIHKGDEASAAFADLPNHTPEEISVIRNNLLKYCGLDTFAMVKVLGKLKQCCK